jgi:hypothetical protein
MTRVRPWRDPTPSPGGTTPWSNTSTLTATWGVAIGRGVCQRLELAEAVPRLGAVTGPRPIRPQGTDVGQEYAEANEDAAIPLAER